MSVSMDLAEVWSSCIQSMTVPGQSDLLLTARAWQVVTDLLKPRTLESSIHHLEPSEEVMQAVRTLHDVNLLPDLLQWHRDEVVKSFATIIEVEIQEYVEDIPKLVLRLASYLRIWSDPHETMAFAVSSTSSSSPLSTFKDMFLSKSTLTMAEFDDARRNEIFQALHAMHYLALFQHFDSVLFKVVYNCIEARIATECADDFETEGLLRTTGQWLVHEIGDWLVSIYALFFVDLDEHLAKSKATEMLRTQMQRFEWHVYSTFFNTRAGEMFDIIVDYPASLPAVDDLTACLSKTDKKSELIKAVSTQIRTRLLHPGANTKDILTQYINLVRVMRIIDPPGILLAKVAAEMRSYLRSRKDTVRCIVSGMVEDEGELLNELRGGPESGEDVKELKEKQDEEAEDYTDDGYKWTPIPLDAPADYSRNRTADIIQLLVSIYDTKELFIKELQVLLAERLLAIKDYDFAKELRNVEILKLRFGEAALSGLEVMLKDCADSKRLDGTIHVALAEGTAPMPLHSLVVSHLFWPTLPKQPLKIPGQLAKFTGAYEASFRKIKPEKRLQWIPTMGSVTMEIALQDRTVEIEVTPIQAAVLEIFTERPERTMRDIQDALQVENNLLIKSALHFWQSKGVLACIPANLAEEDLTWKPIETVPKEMHDAIAALATSTSRPTPAAPVVLAAPTRAPLPATAAKPVTAVNSLQSYAPFIQNALTNLGALPATRLQSMLVALAPGYSGHTLGELELYLESCRREGWLYKSGPNYAIQREAMY